MTEAAPPATALHRLRQSNQERVLGCLRRYGPLSRAELAEHSALSRTTLSTILGGLLRNGTVVESSRPSSNRRGRPSSCLTLNSRAGQYLGLELGRSRVRAVIADASHQVRARGDVPYGAARSVDARLALAQRSVEELAARHGITLDTLTGIGVGSTGPGEAVFASAGGMTQADGPRAARLSGRTRVADQLARAFGVRVGVDNNTRLTALAEATWGRAAGASDLLYVHLSHGVGGGLIIGGQLIRGTGGIAAEVGHLCVDPAGPACWCGARGCLEQYASVRAVLHATGHRGWSVLRSTLEAAGSAEQEAVRAAGRHTGGALATMCTAVNAGRVVLGGELPELGAAFLDPLRESFTQRSMRSLPRTVDISTATVAPWGGALGGLALALHESPLLARYPLPVNAPDTSDTSDASDASDTSDAAEISNEAPSSGC